MFIDKWYDIERVAILGALAYLFLVGAIRIAGKRALSKLNAFDLVVTVALGSTLATILLSSDVSLSEGVIALAILIGAQLLVAKVSTRWPGVRRIIKSEPTLLVRDGQMLTSSLRRERVTQGEVRQAIRASGCGDLGSVGAVVLETDGSMSVIRRDNVGSGSALCDVRPDAAHDESLHPAR